MTPARAATPRRGRPLRSGNEEPTQHDGTDRQAASVYRKDPDEGSTMTKTALLTICLLLAASAANAATYYAATTGTLTTASTSSTNPCNTLQTALNALVAGDTLNVTGTWSTTLTLTQSNAGTGPLPIRIVGTNSSWVADGTYPTISGGTATVITESQGYWEWNNITVTGGNGAYLVDGGSTNYYTTWSNCKFLHTNGTVSTIHLTMIEWYIGCEFSNGGAQGSVIQLGTGATYVNCTIHNGQYGILANYAANAFINCYFYNLVDYAGANQSTGRTFTFVGCTFNNCGSGASMLGPPNGAKNFLINCRATAGPGVLMFAGTGTRVTNSLLTSGGTLGNLLPGSDYTTGTFTTAYTGSSLTLSPTAVGYYTTKTLPDGNLVAASQGVPAAQDPATYSTTASVILSGSYAASGGTLGTFSPAPPSQYVGTYGAGAGTAGTLTGSYSGGATFNVTAGSVANGYIIPSGTGTITGNVTLPIVGTVALGTSYGSSLSLAGTYGQGLTATAGSVASGATFIGANAPTVNSGTLTLAAGGAKVVGTNFSLSTGTLTVTGGTGTGGVVAGGSLAWSVTGYSGSLVAGQIVSTASPLTIGTLTITPSATGYVVPGVNSVLHTGAPFFGPPGSQSDGNYYYQSLDALHVRKGTQWGVGNGQTGVYVKPAGGN